jgi:hypothetical protein
MFWRRALALVAIASWNPAHSQPLAPTQTTWVCWAERPGMCPSGGMSGPTVDFACGSGGNSGFNPSFVCQNICGSPVGPSCRLTAGPGGDGGQCGYRIAKVECVKR